MKNACLTVLLTAVGLASCSKNEVGDVSLGLFTTKDIKIDVLQDPLVTGVTCHISSIEANLNFADPSDSGVSCRQTGKITLAMIDQIDKSKSGDVVFTKSKSIFLKNVKIRRIYDGDTQSLIYLAYSTKETSGSFKHSISTVPLWNTEAYSPVEARSAGKEPAGFAESRQSFGPRIIPINYEDLFKLDEPPPYTPFPVYGAFLFGVANQQLPLVYNTRQALPAHIERISDVVYKEVDGIALGLDVYFNKADQSPKPLILIIHGGYWKAGDKGQFYTQRAVEFVNLGYTVASVNYRLSTTHKYPSNIEDLRDGILFLSAHADRFRIDPTQLVTYGISAGGHLAAFMALAANSDRAYTRGLTPATFKGAISLYGIHDFTLAVQREHPFTELYIGTPYDADSSNYIDASTTSHVDEHDPPVLLMHGSIDGSVSVRNSDKLAQALEAKGVPFVYDRIEGWPHVMDFFSPLGERSLWQTYHFLKKHMPSAAMMGSGGP